MNSLDFMNKFKPKTRCIKEFKYWIICVRQRACTLGAAVIILKREIKSVSEMNKEEATEYSEVIKWYEDMCRQKFGANKFNYLMLMMYDNFVHYHAFPRYEKSVNAFGIDWYDKEYPKAVDLKDYIVLDDDLMNNLVKYMKK